VLGWKEDDNVGRYAEMMVLARRILGIFDFKEHLCRSSCSLVVVCVRWNPCVSDKLQMNHLRMTQY
jgi:hypothetical protein